MVFISDISFYSLVNREKKREPGILHKNRSGSEVLPTLGSFVCVL